MPLHPHHDPARTSLHLDNGMIVTHHHYANDDAPGTLSLPSDRYDALRDDDRVTQVETTLMPDEMHVGRRLGGGSFGVVHECTVRLRDGTAQRLAIKVSTSSTDGARSAFDPDPLTVEFANAELILEPPLVRALRDHEPADYYCYLGNQAVGAPLPALLSASMYRRVVAARNRHAAHVGFGFLHRPVHYAAGVQLPSPLGGARGTFILSEFADGTLRDLQQGSADRLIVKEAAPSPFWLELAWQIMQGVGFINAMTPLRHVDLKPENLLYQRRSGGRVRCMIGDFGICKPPSCELHAAECEPLPAPYLSFRMGTLEFNPCFVAPPDGRMARLTITCAQLSDFQCLATLVDLLAFSLAAEEIVWAAAGAQHPRHGVHHHCCWHAMQDLSAPTVVRAVGDRLLASSRPPNNKNTLMGTLRELQAIPRRRLAVPNRILRTLLEFCLHHSEGRLTWDQLRPRYWDRLFRELDRVARDPARSGWAEAYGPAVSYEALRLTVREEEGRCATMRHEEERASSVFEQGVRARAPSS